MGRDPSKLQKRRERRKELRKMKQDFTPPQQGSASMFLKTQYKPIVIMERSHSEGSKSSTPSADTTSSAESIGLERKHSFDYQKPIDFSVISEQIQLFPFSFEDNSSR